jgi:hypothetical protein
MFSYVLANAKSFELLLENLHDLTTTRLVVKSSRLSKCIIADQLKVAHFNHLSKMVFDQFKTMCLVLAVQIKCPTRGESTPSSGDHFFAVLAAAVKRVRFSSHFLASEFLFLMALSRIKLVALDMDGTTLNNQHGLSPRTLEVLRRLSSKGITIAIATGRSVANIVNHVAELKLEQGAIPSVTFNGAYGLTIDEDNNRQEIFQNQLSREAAQLVLDFSARHGFVVQVRGRLFSRMSGLSYPSRLYYEQ